MAAGRGSPQARPNGRRRAEGMKKIAITRTASLAARGVAIAAAAGGRARHESGSGSEFGSSASRTTSSTSASVHALHQGPSSELRAVAPLAWQPVLTSLPGPSQPRHWTACLRPARQGCLQPLYEIYPPQRSVAATATCQLVRLPHCPRRPALCSVPPLPFFSSSLRPMQGQSAQQPTHLLPCQLLLIRHRRDPVAANLPVVIAP